MVYLYMFLSIVVFYAVGFVLSLFNINVIAGDETIYILLVLIIGVLVYIAETLNEKK